MNRPIKYRAYWSNRIPQLGMCSVKSIDFEDPLGGERVSISNGAVRVFPKLEEIKLLQFTGMLDIHGKEIYEGDIIQKIVVGDKENGNKDYLVQSFEVKWLEQQAGFNITKGNNHYYNIIGNIYENPELLQK